MARHRRMVDLEWLRGHLRRKRIAQGVDLTDDLALLQFVDALPPEKWRRISRTWQQRKHYLRTLDRARHTVQSGQFPLLKQRIEQLETERRDLLSELIAVTTENIQMRSHIAKLQGMARSRGGA